MDRHELRLTHSAGIVPVRFADAGVEWVGAEIGRLFAGRKPRVLIVSDERVALLYESELRRSLEDQGFEIASFIFPPGEDQKTFSQVSSILDMLTERQFARDDIIVGMGGGVATDLAGFAAAICRRGIAWIAIPTSLMGMVDAAIGGKTGVNHPLGKNVIGAFHQPLAVLAPWQTLKTLDSREWLSGSAEVVKSALIAGGKLWDLVVSNGADVYTWPRASAFEAVRLSAETKIKIVAQDECESGLRRILNFGHTFGHALEAVCGYGVLTHGEAIFWGMRAAVRMSHALSLLNSEGIERIENVLSDIELPGTDIRSEMILSALGHDKKTKGDRLHWILLKQIGEPVVTANVPEFLISDTARWLSDELAKGPKIVAIPRKYRILVLNGPNLNLLGEREPKIYGNQTYAALVESLHAHAAKKNVDLLVRQSNIEGELVEMIQRARHWADGIIINAGGYTHTSVAIRDALAAIALPTIEVHLTDISKREEFRRHSLIAPVCRETIGGHGILGYAEAMDMLLSHFNTIARPTSRTHATI